jgi:hypothetical protein
MAFCKVKKYFFLERDSVKAGQDNHSASTREICAVKKAFHHYLDNSCGSPAFAKIAMNSPVSNSEEKLRASEISLR